MPLNRKDPRRQAALLADIRRAASDAVLYIAKKKFADFLAKKIRPPAFPLPIPIPGGAPPPLPTGGSPSPQPPPHPGGLGGGGKKIKNEYKDSVDYLTL